jgi:hypothetical protein
MILLFSSNLIFAPKYSYAQSSNGINWLDMCIKLQSAFYKPCSSYVNPDNTLTKDGESVLKCFKTGGALGVASASLGLPADIVTSGLNFLAGSTGCGNILKPGELNKIGDLGNITNLIK